MTPSKDWNTAPVSLRIDILAGHGCFDLGDVDLLHRHHCRESALGGRLVPTIGGFQQDSGGDLPGETPPVLAPAAHALLAAIPDDRVPIAVSFLLVVGQ